MRCCSASPTANSNRPDPLMKPKDIKNKVGSFLSDPHFPIFLLMPIQRIAPTAARFLRYGRYNPNTADYWDRRYRSGDYQTFESERYADLHGEVAKLVTPSNRILDAGCGTGRLMEILRNLGCSCVGVDISAVAISIVRRKGFRAFKSKLPNLPRDVEENSFDTCTIVETLEHLTNPEKTLKNLRKVLTKNGSIIVAVPDDCMKPDAVDEHVSSFNAHTMNEMMSSYYHIELSCSIETAGHRYLITKGKKGVGQ